MSESESDEEECTRAHDTFSIGIVYYTIAEANECLFALLGLSCKDCQTKFSKKAGGIKPSIKSPVYACEGLKSCDCDLIYCCKCFSK